MADKNQIMIVKTIRKRLIELLGDSKVTVTVSYTSSTDMLRLTFKKILKGAAFELPICTSMKEYLLNPETLQYIVTDALDKMPKPPKWTMETILAEIRRRYYAYRAYVDTISWDHQLRSTSNIGIGVASTDRATQAYYSICGSMTARNHDCETSDLDLFESSFERDAGLVSGGEYTRWREAGEPKRWTDPAAVTMAHLMDQGYPAHHAAAMVVNNGSPTPYVPVLAPTPDPTNWHRMFNTACPIGMSVNNQAMRYYNNDQLDEMRSLYDAGRPGSIPAPRPNTLFGLPVIWADESLPPATRTQEPTNE